MRRNRLTERDLSRIVKRVVMEQKEENEMEGSGMSITMKDVFEEVVNALDELGGYNESMKGKAMELARNIMSIMQENLAYISEDYEEQLHEILGEKDEDYDEDEEF